MIIPAAVTAGTETYAVTHINTGAFSDGSPGRLTSVTIPDSVTRIGYFAFFRNELKKVTIPNSVTNIDEAAFRENKLTEVTLGRAVASVGKQAFAGNQNLTSVVFTGDSAPSVFRAGTSSRSFETASGSLVLTYFADASGFSTPTWKGYKTNAIEAPKVTTQPSDAVIVAGEDASFTAAATGFPVPTVQWQVDTGTGFTDLVGETSPTLDLAGVTTGMDGDVYRAVFSNAVGVVITATAMLTVTEVPVVTTDPRDASVVAGGDVSFTAGVSGFPVPTVRWQVDTGTGFTDLVGETSPTLDLAGVTTGMDGDVYRAVLSNAAGVTTTETATLTVTEVPLPGGNSPKTPAVTGLPDTGGPSLSILILGMAMVLTGALTLTARRRTQI